MFNKEMDKLAAEIARREGGKSQAKIGDVKQVLKQLAQIVAEEAVSSGDNTSASAKVFNDYMKSKVRAAMEVGAKAAQKAALEFVRSNKDKGEKRAVRR